MSAMALTNISTPTGLVNGASGRAMGVVPVHTTNMSNPQAAEFHKLDDLQILCTKPRQPVCYPTQTDPKLFIFNR
jgi:hypothetical protein